MVFFKNCGICGKKFSNERKNKKGVFWKKQFEKRIYCSYACAGKARSKYFSFPSGEKHYRWKGNKVKYRALHAWIERKLGRPTTCEKCGKIELRKYYIHWSNKSGKYKRDVTDWQRLCSSCHGEYDKIMRERR